MFHVIKQEERFRGSGYQYTHQLPKLAVGMTHAFDGTQLDATEFHGSDGLGDVHTTAPQYTCPDEWLKHFDQDAKQASDHQVQEMGFIPSNRPAYLEILEILKNEPADSVVICAVGPLMNLAKAAEIDYPTFSRVKEICIMGGVLNIPGNVTPGAEFNIFSDCLAAERIFDYTSYQTEDHGMIPLDLVLFPLDITHQHELDEPEFNKAMSKAVQASSPLADWINIWMLRTFKTAAEMGEPDKPVTVSLHDPLTVWYAITRENPGWGIAVDMDLRIETQGKWTRGCVIYDKRRRIKSKVPLKNDRGNWRLQGYGNRVGVAVKSPDGDDQNFGKEMIARILSGTN